MYGEILYVLQGISMDKEINILGIYINRRKAEKEKEYRKIEDEYFPMWIEEHHLNN